MRTIFECLTCGTKGLLLLWLTTIPDTDVQLVGRCPNCGKQVGLSLKELIRKQEENRADRTGH